MSSIIYLYRRKGQEDWATCTAKRSLELSTKPDLFELRFAYTEEAYEAVVAQRDALIELNKLPENVTSSGVLQNSQDAARWRAFVNSARIWFFGSSGLNPDSSKSALDYNKNEIPGYVHLGGEFWLQHNAPMTEEERHYVVTALTTYADAAIRAQSKQTIQEEEDQPSDTSCKQEPEQESAVWVRPGSIMFDSSYLSPYFINTAKDLSARLEDPFVLLISGTLSSADQINPVMDKIMKTGHSLIVIADDFLGDALSAMVVRNVRSMLDCVAVKAPNFNGLKTNYMNNLVELTGAVIVGKNCECSVTDVTLEHLGMARNVVVDNKTTFISVAASDEPEPEHHFTSLSLMFKE